MDSGKSDFQHMGNTINVYANSILVHRYYAESFNLKGRIIVMDFSDEFEMFNNGLLPKSTLVTYIIKKIVRTGDIHDFESLPEWTKDEITKGIKDYFDSGTWLIVSNNGEEDFGSIAKEFNEKIYRVV